LQGKRTKDIAVILEGGIGDMLGYTVLLRCLKRIYKHIHVSAAFPEIFIGNPNVNTIYSFDYSYWYKNIVSKVDVISRRDFYRENAVSKMCEHFTKVICNMYNVEHDNIYPDYYPLPSEDEKGRRFVSRLKRPVILMQTFTGISPKDNIRVSNNKHWKLEFTTKFASIASSSCTLLHIGLRDDPIIPNTIPIVGFSIREIISILKYVDTFLCVDSFLNHASAITRKKGVVLWGKSPVEVFSYPHNINVYKDGLCEYQPCGRPDGQLFDLQKYEDGIFRNWLCPDYTCMDISPLEVWNILKNGGVYETKYCKD
jgi:ADP-heptose:LPS heptosyltransferase